jgi:hypothetical protein
MAAARLGDRLLRAAYLGLEFVKRDDASLLDLRRPGGEQLTELPMIGADAEHGHRGVIARDRGDALLQQP